MLKNNYNFVPLLFGGDINVYSVARAFYEEYGITSTVWGKYPSGPCFNSEIINYNICEKNDSQENFIKHVREFAAENKDKKVILVGCGDSYVKLCAENLGNYPENVIAPYVNSDMMNTLIHKEKFYEICEKYKIDYPNTLIHKKEMGNNFKLPFGAPYILKPANSVMYWEYPFATQKKVYKLNTREELEKTIKEIYDAGYYDSLVIQEFISGDDTYMRVLTNYSDKNSEVKLMALGHVLLEEHTPHGIGNHAVILSEYNENLSLKIKGFLDEIGFVGFSNFDIKYDEKDGKYKVFEINVRQGRSNYYVTGSGNNIAKYIVDDYIENKNIDFKIAKESSLWSVVPKYVMFKYIKPEKYKIEMKKLIKEGKLENSLDFSVDKKFKRRISLFKSKLGHVYKYKKYLGTK